jgi:hypothetical protein
LGLLGQKCWASSVRPTRLGLVSELSLGLARCPAWPSSSQADSAPPSGWGLSSWLGRWRIGLASAQSACLSLLSLADTPVPQLSAPTCTPMSRTHTSVSTLDLVWWPDPVRLESMCACVCCDGGVVCVCARTAGAW